MKSFSIFGFSLSISILLYMIYKVGFADVMMAFRNMNVFYFGAAISLYVLNSIIHTYRWKIFIDDMKIRAQSLYLLLITWIGFAINSITPVAISGGEPAKIYYLSKISGIKKSKSMATVAATDFMEIGSFILLDLAAAFIIYVYVDQVRSFIRPIFITIVLGSTAIAGLTYVSMSGRASGFALYLTRMFKKAKLFSNSIDEIENRIEHHVAVYSNALKSISRATFGKAAMMSIMIRLSDVLRLYITVLAFGEHVPIIYIVIANALATAASLVPVLPGSIGALEPALVGGLMLGGVPIAIATAAVMVNRIAVFALDSIVGFPGISIMGRIPGRYSIEGVD